MGKKDFISLLQCTHRYAYTCIYMRKRWREEVVRRRERGRGRQREREKSYKR